MTAKKRILIVDDAAVIRRVLTDIVTDDPDLEVAGTATNGRIALQKIDELEPDLVTLDINMPELDGLETLRLIRADRPKLPVIMFSALTARGAEQTIDALSAGASDYVMKPENLGSMQASIDQVVAELIPRMKMLLARAETGGRSTRRTDRVDEPMAATIVGRPPVSVRAGAVERSVNCSLQSTPEVVVIGTSTGGPSALEVVLGGIDSSIGVPILIVQHMPPLFTRILADRLDSKSEITVVEAEDGGEARPGIAYVAPGDHHLTIEQGPGVWPRLVLGDGPPENSCRPAVDVLFRSAAEVFGSRVLAVVMTGMGQDGLRGVEAIVHRGGAAIVQDEETSVVWGMPGFVARRGLASEVLPLADLAADINRRTRTTTARRIAVGAA